MDLNADPEDLALEELREEVGGAVSPRSGGRFVVQEHHASRLHYDFRLEIGGVLKSWAIPKGPSLDPKVRRLAVEVDDHPLGYLEFAGTIAEGTYGAGEVVQWDLGTYEVLSGNPQEAWEQGSLHLLLHGRRLRGEWRLYRIRGGGKPQWLLQRQGGDAADRAEEADALGEAAPPSGRAPSPGPPAGQSRASGGRSPDLAGGGRPPGPAVLTQEEFLARTRLEGDVTLEAGEDTVRLTNLSRLYWPEERITKARLLQYYIRVASALLPLLEGRPAVLKRFPQGITGPSFHQHDIDAPPAFLRTHHVERAGHRVDYPVYTDLASLLYLVNLGAIEQHPWHSRADDPQHPDWMVIDLDPHESAWSDVVAVAQELRDELSELGLCPYLKTSGSRGLHVYVPLEPGYTYAQVSGAAEAVCRRVVERLPRVATMERALADRQPGQVYLDWMQNAQGKTMVSAFSVRARPGALVSCPITWDELQAGARLEDFDLDSVPLRLSGGRMPWLGMLEHRQQLPSG